MITQWSNCGGTRGNGVLLPFLAGKRRSPSLHDHCGSPTSEFKPEQYMQARVCWWHQSYSSFSCL